MLIYSSIVEYATPEQAQQAIATLTNKELQGRVVYVREVREILTENHNYIRLTRRQDREQEPRFGGGGAPRGGFGGGMMGRGGFQGGYGGGGGNPNAGRQLYVSNVCPLRHFLIQY